jgi:redox-sensitive bicupin YhaK (pirin superfamily)
MEEAMITIRKADERGHAQHGWLDSRHTFSFADYYDQRAMGFRSLRVINEDRVQPGQGFGTHGHSDMEIISYVLEGALEHRDSMGTGSIIRPGDVQKMSAGTGVQHSEFNASRQDPVHFYQIWIHPGRRGIKPEYEQKRFPPQERKGVLRLVASPDGAQGSLTIHTDARLYAATLEAGKEIVRPLAGDRFAWIQVVRGEVRLNGQELREGDGAAVAQVQEIKVSSPEGGEILFFDLA